MRNGKRRTVSRKTRGELNRNRFAISCRTAGKGCRKRNFRNFADSADCHFIAVNGNEVAITRPLNQYFGIGATAFGKLDRTVAVVRSRQAKRTDGGGNLVFCRDSISVNKTDKVCYVVAVFTIVLRCHRTADGLKRTIVTKIEFNVLIAISIRFEHGNNRLVCSAPVEFGNRSRIEDDVVMTAVIAYTHTDIVLNRFRFVGNSVFNFLLEVEVEVGFATGNVFSVDVSCFCGFRSCLEVIAVHVASKIHILCQAGLMEIELVGRAFSGLAVNGSRYILADCFYGKSEVLRFRFAVRSNNRCRKNVGSVFSARLVNVYLRNVALVDKLNAVNVNAPSKRIVYALYVGKRVGNFKVNVVVRIHFLIVHALQNSLNCLEVDHDVRRTGTITRSAAVYRGICTVISRRGKTTAQHSNTRERSKNAD